MAVSPDDPKYRGMLDCINYARTVAAPRTPDCTLGGWEYLYFYSSKYQLFQDQGSRPIKQHPSLMPAISMAAQRRGFAS